MSSVPNPSDEISSEPESSLKGLAPEDIVNHLNEAPQRTCRFSECDNPVWETMGDLCYPCWLDRFFL